MKLIGLMGGLSWESSAEYYRLLNEIVRERLGGLHSAPILMYSFDFAPVVDAEVADDLANVAEQLLVGIRAIEEGGADFLIIACNSVHMVADLFEPKMRIPLVHIVDPVGDAIVGQGLRKVGLLGTGYTMGKPFYVERLAMRFDVEGIVPDERDRADLHRIIFDELCLGVVKDESRKRFLKVIDSLVSRGAEGIILGCTELPVIVADEDVDVPLFDSTQLHVERALEIALD